MPSCGQGECLVSGVRTISWLVTTRPSWKRYCRRAWARWSWLIGRPVHAALSDFFIDFTVASTLPLLCGYWGADVACRKPHCFAKSLNCLDVNCGPPSDQNVSGTPVQQKDALRAEISCMAVVLLSIGMISGQSE